MRHVAHIVFTERVELTMLVAGLAQNAHYAQEMLQ